MMLSTLSRLVVGRNRSSGSGLRQARILLLVVVFWLGTSTGTIFVLLDRAFSLRDFVLLGGGLFILTSAARELHEKMEDMVHILEGVEQRT